MKALLRDAIAVAAVSGLVFQALRQWVGEHYVVPTNSMQPTLYGDGDRGDVVFVDKLARVGSLQRYDLAVFRVPGEGADVVKRVVAFGDECIEPRDGDLWVGPSPQHLQRLQKDPLADRDLRVPWLRWPGPQPGGRPLTAYLRGSADPAAVALPTLPDEAGARATCTVDARRAAAAASLDAEGPHWLATVRAIDVSYLDIRGGRGNADADLLVQDCGVDLEVAPSGVQALLCAIDLRPDCWTVRWQLETGAVELWRNGETLATGQLPRDLVPAGRTAPVRVEFGHLDGRLFLIVDGRADAVWVEARRAEWITADPGPTAWPLPKNRLALAVLGAGPAPVVRIEVFRDLHWYRLPMEIGIDPATAQPARTVPGGHIYLLGDNSTDSRDSRMFGPVPARAFIGRPRAVLGPWPRLRMLRR